MKKEKIQEKNKKRNTLKLFYFLIAVFIFYILFFNLRNSAFFQKKDRINVVFSQDQIAFYSLGLVDKVNYFISYFPDLEAVVPGGYGYYRLGALAKLASLEKKPDLFKKTYSVITSSFVDFHFYPSASSDKIEVLFGADKKDFSTPGFNLIFFGTSNAQFMDRIFLYLQFLGKTKGQFKNITSLPVTKKIDRTIISSSDFFKTYQGIFYKKTYRTEQRNVQILYTKSYKTAQILGQILEGEGIRVVDLSKIDVSGKKCQVFEDKKDFSDTAWSIGRFFGCQLSHGETEAYDIILKLGKVEEEWEVE